MLAATPLSDSDPSPEMTMKSQWFLPPAIALIVVILADSGVRSDIREKKERVALLTAAMKASAEDAANAGLGNRRPPGASQAAEANKPINWQEIARAMEEMERGGSQLPIRRLQQRLLEMNVDELAAALIGIAALDLSEKSRTTLESIVLDAHVLKDPQDALTRYVARLSEDRQSLIDSFLSDALKTWADKDPGAAAAWMDMEIEKGTFDSKTLDGKSRSGWISRPPS